MIRFCLGFFLLLAFCTKAQASGCPGILLTWEFENGDPQVGAAMSSYIESLAKFKDPKRDSKLSYYDFDRLIQINLTDKRLGGAWLTAELFKNLQSVHPELSITELDPWQWAEAVGLQGLPPTRAYNVQNTRTGETASYCIYQSAGNEPRLRVGPGLPKQQN